MSKHGWTYKKLGEVSTVAAGQGAPQGKSNYSEIGTPFVKAGNLEDLVKGCSIHSIQQVNQDVAISHRLKKFRAGSILFAKSGMSCMKGWVYTLPCDSYVVSHLAIVTAFDINPHLLNYYFQFNRPNKLVKDSAYPSISLKDIENMPIPVPEMAEQEAIVAELDEINEAIAALQQQVADFDTLAQATFYEMFGDPVTNPKGWEVKKLNESVHEMFLGPFGSALKVSCYVPENESFAMVYEQKHAIQGTLNLENHFINKEKFDSLARFEVKPKDFIMSCRGTIGRIFQLPYNAPKGIIHPSLMKIRIKNDIYEYTFFVPLLQKVIAEQTTKGNCVQMAITAKELGNMDFILPPLALQREFAERVEAIEAAKAELSAQIAEMQTLLASRMDFWFAPNQPGDP